MKKKIITMMLCGATLLCGCGGASTEKEPSDKYSSKYLIAYANGVDTIKNSRYNNENDTYEIKVRINLYFHIKKEGYEPPIIEKDSDGTTDIALYIVKPTELRHSATYIISVYQRPKYNNGNYYYMARC